VTVTSPEIRSLLPAAEALLPELVAVRRRLHRRPEVGLQLPGTQAVVVEELEKLGLTARLGRTSTSVVAVIEGAGAGSGGEAVAGPTVLLRADMDALAVAEETGLEFSSENAGTMHACGHDAHIAMLLGAARLLVERKATFAGRVLLMFQPGEEGLFGAQAMLDERLLDQAGPTRPGGAFALHIFTMFPASTISVRSGPIMASADTLRIVVRGRGGHASNPSGALDPVTVAAELVIALQTMITRQVSVFEPAVITIAHVTAGTTDNIIPESAALEGTIRTLSDRTRKLVHEAIPRLAHGIAEAHGATADVEVILGYPVTVNDPAFAELVRDTAVELLGADLVPALDEPIMTAEDFSYVLEQVPGAMAFIGARPTGQDPATAPTNHSNRVIFDEAAMATGAATYAAVALRSLAQS
jgi:hippurate hydrolase